MRTKAAITATISMAIWLAGVGCQHKSDTRASASATPEVAHPSGMNGVAPITLEGTKTTRRPETTPHEASATPADLAPQSPRPATPSSGPLPLAFAQASPEDAAPRIPIKTVEKLLAKKDVVIVDVRDEAEYQAEHAEGAINIPLPEIAQRIDQLPHDKMIVAYCT